MKNRIYNIKRELGLFGVVYWVLGAARFYYDEGRVVALWRWYHPVVWLGHFLLLGYCAYSNWKVQELMPVDLPPYWRERHALIKWL